MATVRMFSPLESETTRLQREYAAYVEPQKSSANRKLTPTIGIETPHLTSDDGVIRAREVPLVLREIHSRRRDAQYTPLHLILQYPVRYPVMLASAIITTVPDAALTTTLFSTSSTMPCSTTSIT
jgi:hypothetical protein